MFILHSSNKTENLLAHLLQVQRSSPLSSPFSRETFLIQSQGMERWLSQRLASHFKVWANYDFFFPNKFFSHVARQIDSDLNDQAFARESLLWRFEALLRDLQEPCFLPLRGYLVGENSALKRYQLAQQLAAVFDQYQIMRPDMLEAWTSGQPRYRNATEAWQMVLWRRLTEQAGSRHRGTLWLDAIARLMEAPESSLAGCLPERISVFGLNAMPPLLLGFLQALARHCQVHLYLLNPAQSYWADLYSRGRQVLHSNDIPADAQSMGHSLLATLGQQGREFQELLLEQAQFELEAESFEESEAQLPLSNLQQLQKDILNNRPVVQRLTRDGSIAIHACHSRRREVQVLKDLLLQTLQDNPQLQLRDIVVMAPDIECYSAYIDAVFDDIQHAVADRSLRLSNPVLDAFIGFLRLTQGRFGWQEVLDLLAQPAVHGSFGLSETDLELVRHWVEEIQVRWGRSAQHKARLGLPETRENTWQAGLERLLMGYAVAEDHDFVDGVLPYIHIEGASSEVLGGLYDFLQLLFQASSELAQEKTLQAWGEQLYRYADRLFMAASVESAERRQLHELLSELGDNLAVLHHEEVQLQVIISWLEGQVAERKSVHGFLRGQLTFCSMLPMRSIPFQVIALLGMNEGDFPKPDRHPSFDLLQQHFQKGDRSRRADDRYQFLEILLSARRQLLITYVGQSLQQHNQPLPPSVVVSELLEVLQDRYRLTDLVTLHPMQPFSPRYFQGHERLPGHSQSDFQTAMALLQPPAPPTAWWQDEIAVPDAEVVELQDLFAFYRHPQRYFLRRQLALQLGGREVQAEESEPFSVAGLDAYQIDQQWLEDELRGMPVSLEKLQAQGRWLSGACGSILYQRHKRLIGDFALRVLAREMGDRRPDLSVDLQVGPFRLVGNLANIHRQGSLFYRYADLKGRDFLQAWLQHLIVNRVRSQPTCLICKDADFRFEPEYCQPETLLDLLELYDQGQKRPSPLIIEPALAYCRQAVKLGSGSRSGKTALDMAQQKLLEIIQYDYDKELKLLCRDMQDPAELLDAAFEAQCRALLLPAWEAVHGN